MEGNGASKHYQKGRGEFPAAFLVVLACPVALHYSPSDYSLISRLRKEFSAVTPAVAMVNSSSVRGIW